MSGNPSSVVVRFETSAENVAALAAEHCGKYGKNARLSFARGLIWSFDCV